MTKNNQNDQPVPEKPDLKLGFIPLTDCCVLVVASEMGLFEKHGLNVELSKEASWANIRDKVCVGALDGAHMLAGMPIATTLGLGFTSKAMVTAFSMDLNGNAITVSDQLFERLLTIDNEIVSDPGRSANALKQAIDEDKKADKGPLTFATVYPYSNHNYEIRYWLASAGIDPDHDVRLRVIPPQYMVENLRVGQIDGFCVGEPWNSYAVKEDVGKILITGYDIWNNSPEKVFGVTREWAEKYPQTHICVIKALLESAVWIDEPENRDALAEILADEKYIGISKDVINTSIAGEYEYLSNGKKISIPDFNVFYRYLANFPWCSHACWIMTQMYRWGQIEEGIDIRQLAEAVYRPDIYRQAAEQMGINYPALNYKTEGQHQSVWTLNDEGNEFMMGADHFLDGKLFDANELKKYLFDFDVSNIKVNLDEFQKHNS